MPRSVSSGPATRFRNAITRLPPLSATDGLRAVDTGAPDVALMRHQHEAYVAALQAAGVAVHRLEPLESCPDSHFVEDTALCLPEGAILLRPGAPSRAPEVAAIEPALRAAFENVITLEGDGTIEGGDILFTGREVIVGLSARTTRAGAEAFGQALGRWGHDLRIVQTPPDVLHFKTACSLLDESTILATGSLAETGCFADYRVILTAEGEEAAANVIRVNDTVIMPEGFAHTRARLEDAGYRVAAVPNSECARLDGGMSCLSLRF